MIDVAREVIAAACVATIAVCFFVSAILAMFSLVLLGMSIAGILQDLRS